MRSRFRFRFQREQLIFYGIESDSQNHVGGVKKLIRRLGMEQAYPAAKTVETFLGNHTRALSWHRPREYWSCEAVREWPRRQKPGWRGHSSKITGQTLLD